MPNLKILQKSSQRRSQHTWRCCLRRQGCRQCIKSEKVSRTSLPFAGSWWTMPSKNAMAVSKLQYILRTTPCAGNSFLSTFDKVLHCGLSKILNVNLNDTQWTQATLPVYMGDLGVRSAFMLASSAFLASAAATLSLQEAILPDQVHSTADLAVSMSLSVWKTLTPDGQPSNTTKHIQKAWDTPVVWKI